VYTPNKYRNKNIFAAGFLPSVKSQCLYSPQLPLKAEVSSLSCFEMPLSRAFTDG
jgi:hypothetical protein